jgi:hypothetical protein
MVLWFRATPLPHPKYSLLAVILKAPAVLDIWSGEILRYAARNNAFFLMFFLFVANKKVMQCSASLWFFLLSFPHLAHAMLEMNGIKAEQCCINTNLLEPVLGLDIGNLVLL